MCDLISTQVCNIRYQVLNGRVSTKCAVKYSMSNVIGHVYTQFLFSFGGIRYETTALLRGAFTYHIGRQTIQRVEEIKTIFIYIYIYLFIRMTPPHLDFFGKFQISGFISRKPFEVKQYTNYQKETFFRKKCPRQYKIA